MVEVMKSASLVVSHGFISGAMFSCVGVRYDRMHTRMIRDYGCGAIIPQGDGVTLAQAILYFRNDPDAWFNAQQGAEQAALDCRPVKSILSIMKEAETTIQTRVA